MHPGAEFTFDVEGLFLHRKSEFSHISSLEIQGSKAQEEKTEPLKGIKNVWHTLYTTRYYTSHIPSLV